MIMNKSLAVVLKIHFWAHSDQVHTIVKPRLCGLYNLGLEIELFLSWLKLA